MVDELMSGKVKPMVDILEFLNQEELSQGIAKVREACRKYLLKKTYSGCERIKRKPIPKAWIHYACAIQKGICPRCDEPMLWNDIVGDHITPLAKGGQHNRHNIQAMHSKCNASKGANDMVRESKLEQVGKTRRVPIDEEI